MIEKLIKLYSAIEEKIPIFTVQKEYNYLTRANENGDVPIQRWYNCKEAFSVDLLEKLITDWKIPFKSIHRILDPFVGIGTTLLAAQKLHKNLSLDEAIGIDVNPFFHFVSSTKIKWFLYDKNKFRRLGNKILSATKLPFLEIPELTTLHREDIFKKDIIKNLLGYKSLIFNVQEIESDLLLLGLSNILEQVSGVRKDGRALRIVEKSAIPPVKEALYTSWDKIYLDLEKAPEIYDPFPCMALKGDGRILKGKKFSKNSLGKFDIILCSPPYLNNIDYTEVYKIELWILDFLSSYDEFRELRHKTFRSHPSVRFKNKIHLRNDGSISKFIEYLDTLKNSLPKNKDFKWRSRLFEEYFDDVYLSLKNQWDVLDDDGWVFWVIGNSLHGSIKERDKMVPVAVDILIAQIARNLGFTVKGLMIARKLRRRSHEEATNYFLRESIISLKKN